MFAGPLVAVETVIKEQSTRTLPLGFTCTVVVNGGLWSAYAGVILRDPMVFLPNFIGLLLGLVQLSLFFRYGIYHKAADISLEGDADGYQDVELVAQGKVAQSVVGHAVEAVDYGL